VVGFIIRISTFIVGWISAWSIIVFIVRIFSPGLIRMEYA
jgi:hypothetical protein